MILTKVQAAFAIATLRNAFLDSDAERIHYVFPEGREVEARRGGPWSQGVIVRQSTPDADSYESYKTLASFAQAYGVAMP